MTMLNAGQDGFWWGKRFGHDDDHSTIVFTSDGAPYEATIEDDVYSMLSGSSVPTYLAVAVRDAMTLASGTSFTLFIHDVSHGGVTHYRRGLRVESGDPFEIDTDDSSPELLRALGFEPGQGTLASSEDGPVESLVAPGLYGLHWRSPRAAQHKRRNTIREAYTSGGRGQSIQPTIWGADQIRTFRYTQIPAAHVIEGRANIEAFAEVGNLDEGWGQNAFYHLWDEAISTYGEVYAAYNVDFSDILSDLYGFPGPFDDTEILRSAGGSSYAEEFDECVARESRSAEHYTIEFGLRVESSEWGQG